MATVLKQNAYDTIVTVMTTALNSIANNAWSAASAAQGADATAAALYGDWTLTVTFGTAPTINTTVDLYLIRAADGANYEDGSSSVVPGPNTFVGSFSLRAVTTAQVRTIRDVRMPPGLYKSLILNNGTGQAFAASGNTLTVRPHNLQSV